MQSAKTAKSIIRRFSLIRPEPLSRNTARPIFPRVVEPRGQELDIFEKRYFTEGNLGFPVTALRTGESARLGMLICYDRRFSEAYRALALDGAELICIPYNTPTFGRPPEEGHETAEILLRAAAIENQVFIVAAGKAGVEDGVEYIGAVRSSPLKAKYWPKPGPMEMNWSSP